MIKLQLQTLLPCMIASQLHPHCLFAFICFLTLVLIDCDVHYVQYQDAFTWLATAARCQCNQAVKNKTCCSFSFVDLLYIQLAGKIDNSQLVCGVFSCVVIRHLVGYSKNP